MHPDSGGSLQQLASRLGPQAHRLPRNVLPSNDPYHPEVPSPLEKKLHKDNDYGLSTGKLELHHEFADLSHDAALQAEKRNGKERQESKVPPPAGKTKHGSRPTPNGSIAEQPTPVQ